MSLHLQREIDSLKKAILSEGKLVQKSLQSSVKAFTEGDAVSAKKIIRADGIIDRKEIEVEEECLKILALHQPVAIDLRFIISVLKINNDLERIGDLASNIAGRARSLAKKPPIAIPDTIQNMAILAQNMVKNSLESLVGLDVKIADMVLNSDDEVDAAYSKMYKITTKLIRSDPENMEQYIQLIGVSRNLERAADHATNIAQDVLYMVEGQIHRHPDLESN